MAKGYQLTVGADEFLLDGKPFRILSGAIHYFRVHPGCWRDRLQKLRACGFNTVETYIPWNLHEPKEGQYRFDGFADVERFVALADELGLKVILRPGPYICAEWDFGGLPAWLRRTPGMRVRCHYAPFLEKVDRWFSVLLPRLVPHMSGNGGPVIAMQVENEYGSFGCDKKYLRHLEQTMRDEGMDCLLFTSDGWDPPMLRGGTLPHLHKTVNFGSRPAEAFSALRAVQPDGPDMCCEFWCGWFDHWGEAHHIRDAHEVARTLDEMLILGASVNMYMFHGGTNFGFTSGANLDQNGDYQPTTTSYDYHALLDEAGNTTPLYDACREVLTKHFGEPPALPISVSPSWEYGTVALTEVLPLLEMAGTLAEPVHCATPLSMDELDQFEGYMLYRTRLHGPMIDQPLRIPSLRDRATVFLDGRFLGAMYRNDKADSVYITVPDGQSAQLDILVENMGRVNYGCIIDLPRGISGYVMHGYQSHFDWEMYALPMKTPPTAWQKAEATCAPGFLRGQLMVDEVADTYLDMQKFGKGFVFVNGFNLGRFWEIGPMTTLYVPSQVLRPGANEVVVFTSEGRTCFEVPSVAKHRLLDASASR